MGLMLPSLYAPSFTQPFKPNSQTPHEPISRNQLIKNPRSTVGKNSSLKDPKEPLLGKALIL
jgi:hypothetical protein